MEQYVTLRDLDDGSPTPVLVETGDLSAIFSQLIGAVVGALTNLFGRIGQDNLQQQLAETRAELERTKKMMTFIVLGAVVVVLLILFLKR